MRKEKRICRIVRCKDDRGKLPHTLERSNLQRQPQRAIASLRGSPNMHRIRAVEQKGA
jgi:hypothetical protein